MGWGESEYTVVGDSKILTVSYGTFSCTLEGFDEPFSTMKAISEYFRDLAERDRFFGAEPPQPDAEYLHRIAEQTIKSRVEAEVTDNALILRQEQDTSEPAPNAAPVAAPVAAHVAAPVAAPAMTAEAAPAVAPEMAPAAAPDPVADLAPAPQPETAAFVQPVVIDHGSTTDGDSIAQKLQRIRAVVSREAAEPSEDTSLYNEDEHAEDVSDASDAMDADAPAGFAAQDSFEDEAEGDADSDVLGSVMADVLAQATPEPAEEAAPQADDVVAEESHEDGVQADDVQADDAQAEVAQTVDAQADDAQAEAEPEAEVAADAADANAETVAADVVAQAADVEAPEAVTVEADVPAEAPAENEAKAEADADMAEADAQADVQADVAQDEEPAAEAAAPAAADEGDVDLSDIMAPIAKPRRRIIVQKVSRAEVEAVHADAEADAPSAELDPEAEAALMRELAEVEAEMTVEAAAVEDAADAGADAASLAAEQAAQATAEAEAEAKAAADALANVMAEATQVEAEVEADPAQDPAPVAKDAADGSVAESTEDDTSDENRAARIARRSLMVEDEDAALNRLMDATSTRLSDDDEGAVRRASIAHLKAAVAATKADDSIAKAAADEEERELDQYRDDLARVVRPGRARPRSEGAATSRPAPLVLVSEQRIDTPAPQAADAAAAMDVRPRRITSGNLALAEEMEEEVDTNVFADANVESFSDYAVRHDALELPDLLEAAAAHYAFVEGAEEFTRPMLMRKISSLTTGEAPSREAGLRSFGSLLREGRVVKSGNGKFVLSGKSRFTSEAREAGE